MRPLVTAAGAGSLSSLLVSLAGDLLRDTPHVLPTPSELCSVLPPLPEIWSPDPYSIVIGFAAGITVGFLVGPLFDLLVVIRLAWARFIRARLGLGAGYSETEARSEVTRSSQSSAGRTVETEDTEGRAALAKELGQFLRRCLSGEHRGTSGRDRLRLQNRFYIVCADYHGKVLPEPLFLDNFASSLLVSETGEAKVEYQPCHLVTQTEGEECIINLVPIALHQGKLLVAAPAEAWSRTVADRLLPKNSFKKPVLVEVLTATVTAPEELRAEAPMNVWVGLLERVWSMQLEPGRHELPTADIWHLLPDGDHSIPYGPGLAQVSEEHFAFLTAQSGEAAEGALERLAGEPARPPALRKPGVKPANPTPARLRATFAPGTIPGLDPTVVQSALDAGIPEEQLRTLSGLLQKPNQMGDAPLPGTSSRRRKSVSVEADREDGLGLEEDGLPDEKVGTGDPVEQALLKLTEIVGTLAKDKRPRDLDAMLDGLDPEAGEASSSGSGKYKKLQSSLTENPAVIYQTIEAQLEKDFNLMRAAPGATMQQTSARAWLEHRSRLGYYPTTIRYAWALTGIWDALRSGAVKEARARCALAVAACDQSSIDQGSWLLSQEVLLEQPALLQSFQGRRSPEPWEQSGSKLLDERWLEVFMWRLKSKDSYLESRKRLTQTGGKGKADAGGGAPPKADRDKDKDKQKKGNQKGKEGKKEKGPLEVPGAGATSVLGYELWNGLFTALSRGRSRLKLAWFHARASRAQARAPLGVLWPLPVPFPELHRKGANRGQKDASRKLGLNYCVIVLNYLHGSERHWKSVIPPLGTPLNGSQWDLVRRLRRHVDVWNAEEVVTSAEMGRSATKVESLEDVLNQLQAEAEIVHSGLKSYGSKAQERLRTDWGMRGAPGSVVGKLDVAPAHPAKVLEPDRLQFWGEPSFDPRPFMDPANVSMFEFPLQHAIDPAELPEPPPRVRVRCPPTERLAFLQKLDACKRLALRPTRTIREGFQNGVFAIPKDEQRDRMVLDARPPNALEQSEQRWIKSLAGLHQLHHFFLQKDECLYLFAEDLREFYHAFVISEERILRNALKMSFRPWELKALDCFSQKLLREKSVTPCLKTMAMGDTNAVAFGQASHLVVLLQSGALELDHFITLFGRPPRQRWLAGLMIDDLVLLEARPDQATEETEARAAYAELDCSQRIRQVREQYEKVRLPRHSGKAVFNETRGSFWGVQMDGVAGDLRPNLKRGIPLSHIILRVLNLGCCTVALLEVIAGSLVSIFSLRRRFMSVLQEIYEAQKNRQRNEIVCFSPELQDELFCALGLVSLTHLDMRLRPSDYLVASDASSTAEGAVATKIGQKATEAYLREKGIEDLEACELPEGEYDMHPLWQEIVVEQGKKQPDSFYLHLQDSQVSLAALTKGRSSSRSVNALIRQSIPDAVAYNNRAFYGYVRSRLNPADDPTRDVVIRAPVRTEAEWLADLKEGEYDKLEAALAQWELSISDLRQLPDECELLAPAPVDRRTGLEARKQRRKDLRKHAAELKVKAVSAAQHELKERQTDSLSEEALAVLRSFPEDQFIWHQRFASLEDALQSGAGVLDLFSGSRGFARACVQMAET
ncbi:unnamed protein product [Cladocopium goreaui]|uniref:Uncharacterized protein n=1 Tax=Cladocopium goreaui TaxID=2562237 RepID=A0A9P1FRX9_9DINO|nr:unnamed protein product [Cladocopium goreaui]